MPRFNLPEINFAEKSAQQMEADILARYEHETGIRLALADPRRKFIQAIILLLVQQRALIDFSTKQNLLGYATDDFLDHIGALSDTERLSPTPSMTTIRFNLSTAFPQVIPVGTRGTAGDGVFFATTETVTVEGGQISVDVEAVCTQAGIIGNGYLPGEINQLVDPLQWVQSIENITESQGGADLEDNDHYAQRIYEAPESFSVAGPEGAYIYWAKTANQLIIDVSVRSPAPGVIEIRPLLKGGQLPGQDILEAVFKACTPKDIRPLTDKVEVLAPEQVNYDISITYWINKEQSTLAGDIQKKVNQAVEAYKLWQNSKFGRGIDPSELSAMVKNAGAKRVMVTQPAYQALQKHQVAKDELTTLIYGGQEDD